MFLMQALFKTFGTPLGKYCYCFLCTLELHKTELRTFILDYWRVPLTLHVYCLCHVQFILCVQLCQYLVGYLVIVSGCVQLVK